MTAFDLGNLHLIVDRPDATPAPWPGHIDVTPETGGIPDDRVAQVLYLRGLGRHVEARQIEQQMTATERAELAQYYRPGLREVA